MPFTDEEALDLKARWDQVLAQAVMDMEFRQRLLADPNGTLREAGIDVSEEQDILVLEFDPNRPVLILPPPFAPIAQDLT